MKKLVKKHNSDAILLAKAAGDTEINGNRMQLEAVTGHQHGVADTANAPAAAPPAGDANVPAAAPVAAPAAHAGAGVAAAPAI